MEGQALEGGGRSGKGLWRSFHALRVSLYFTAWLGSVPQSCDFSASPRSGCAKTPCSTVIETKSSNFRGHSGLIFTFYIKF